MGDNLPGTPVVRTLPAGFPPEDLDGALKKFIGVADYNVRQAGSLAKRVEQALQDLEGAHGEDALDTANKLTILYDRMTKAGLNVVKAIDELSRLRSFIAGGPDSRPDLTVKGELELRAIVLKAVKHMGPTVVAELVEELKQ